MRSRAAHALILSEQKLQELDVTSRATAEEDRRFIQEHPVNGDIDSSPYPLLTV